jgi:chaperonin GroES
MNVKPLHDRIIVKRLESEERTAGGIIIPDSAKEKPVQGKVMAVGDGKKDDKGNRLPIDVKVGDRVLFSRYGGTDIKVGDEELLIMREDDILGIVED